MNKAKKIFYTAATGAAIGMVLGVLFAPDKGWETRKKLNRLKAKFTCPDTGIYNNKKALQELSEMLEKELAAVNEKIEKLS